MLVTNKNINFFYYSKTIYFACFLVIATFFSTITLAQQTQDIINQQDWITRNQQNILEEKKRDSEFGAIKKDRDRKKKEEEENQEPQPLNVSEKSTTCFPIKKIKFQDANSLSWFRKKKLAAPFIGKCLEEKVLTDIVASINNYYQSKGFIMAQVLLPKQNLQSGIFELKIIEGKIEKISLGQDRVIEKMQEFTAFGDAEGEVLNINDINQGIYQINRLHSNAAIMKIEPGSVNGDSKIVIDNNKSFPARATISKDNLGNKFTGVQRANFSSNFDNLLFLNDNLNLSYTNNIHDDSQVKDLKAFSSSLSIPFKYNTFSYDYSRSEFKGQSALQNSIITYTGFSDQRKFTIDRVLLSKTNLRLSTSGSLTSKESASYLNGVKQENSIRKLSVMNVGFALSFYPNDRTNIYLKPSYSRGLKILNAQQDTPNVGAAIAKSQFEVFKFYANFSHKLTIPKINAPVVLSTEVDSQFAKQTLFGSEQFSVGGYYSVRGFRESYITGDSGYYFRNKASFNIGSLISPLFNTQNQVSGADSANSQQNFLQKNLPYLNRLKLEPFYDFGYVRNKYNGSDGGLSGAGVKTIFDSKYFSASVTYSQGLQKSHLITSITKENKLIYFEISASCC